MTGDIDFFWNEYTSLKDWIVFSDAKAGAIIAFYGIIGTLLLPKAIEIYDSIKQIALLNICFAVTLSLVALSIVQALWSIFPDLTVKQPSSLIFYTEIKKGFPTAEQYINAVYNEYSDTEKTKNDLLGQIWALANVADRKFNLVRRSYFLLMIAIIVSILGTYYKIFIL